MKHIYTTHSLRIVLLLIAAVLIGLFACEKTFDSRHPSDPQGTRQGGVLLKIIPGGTFDTRAKAMQLIVTIEKNMRQKADAPDDWQSYIHYAYPEDPSIGLSFPFTVKNLTLPYPPYEYRIKVAAILSRNTTVESAWQRLRIDDGEVYLGNNEEPSTTVEFLLETYETLVINGFPLRVEKNGQLVPENDDVDPNEPLTVRCGNVEVDMIDAPDSDRFPVSIMLWEEGKNGMSIVSEPFTAVENAVMEGTFPDPYSNNLLEHEQRVFICTISDTHGTSATFSTRITRKLPEPIEVSLDCDASSALVVERNVAGGAVNVFVNGENTKDLTITLASGVLKNAGTQGEPGGQYSIDGFDPEVDPQTGRPYIQARGSHTWCPVAGSTPIVIEPVCNALWNIAVQTADGTNLGQDTTVEIFEAGLLCVPMTILNGTSSQVSPSCCAASGNVLTINSISVGTDASGRPITGVGNTCICP